MTPEIVVVKDYDGFFEQLVKAWVKRKADSGKTFNHTRIEINSGPYRPSVVSYASKDKILKLDFYAAFRTGMFGSITDEEVEQMIEIL